MFAFHSEIIPSRIPYLLKSTELHLKPCEASSVDLIRRRGKRPRFCHSSCSTDFGPTSTFPRHCELREFTRETEETVSTATSPVITIILIFYIIPVHGSKNS